MHRKHEHLSELVALCVAHPPRVHEAAPRLSQLCTEE